MFPRNYYERVARLNRASTVRGISNKRWRAINSARNRLENQANSWQISW